MAEWWETMREFFTTKTPREQFDVSLDAYGLTVAEMVNEDVEYVHVSWDDVLMMWRTRRTAGQ